MSFVVYKKNNQLHEVRFLITEDVRKKSYEYAKKKYDKRKANIKKGNRIDVRIYNNRVNGSKDVNSMTTSEIEIELLKYLRQEYAAKASEFAVWEFYNFIGDPCMAPPDTQIYEAKQRTFEADLKKSDIARIHIKNQEEEMMQLIKNRKGFSQDNPSGTYQNQDKFGNRRGNYDVTFYRDYLPGDVTTDTITYRNMENKIAAMGVWCCVSVPVIHQKRLMGPMAFPKYQDTKEALWKADLDKAGATWSGLTATQMKFLMDQAIDITRTPPPRITTVLKPVVLNHA